MLNGTEKTPPLITDYKEYHTDTTVKFVVKMSEEKLAEAEAVGLHKVFKLQTNLTCNSMVRNGFCWREFWFTSVMCPVAAPASHENIPSQQPGDLGFPDSTGFKPAF